MNIKKNLVLLFSFLISYDLMALELTVENQVNKNVFAKFILVLCEEECSGPLEEQIALVGPGETKTFEFNVRNYRLDFEMYVYHDVKGWGRVTPLESCEAYGEGELHESIKQVYDTLSFYAKTSHHQICFHKDSATLTITD